MSRVDDRLVADVARRLRAGGHRFSERQLWYAVCAALERPPATAASAQVIAGTLMIAIGVVVGVLTTPFVAMLVPMGMVVFATGLQRRRAERQRPSTRPLALSFDEFARSTTAPARAPGHAGIEGLLVVGVEDAEQPPPVDAEVPLLVCDHGETAAVLVANAAAGGLDCVVVEEAGANLLIDSRRAYALHDADPRGCRLPLRLLSAGAAEVVDLGLRPSHITGRHLQVIEGAPTQVGAELAGLLLPDELVWLAEGRRVELAVLTPAELVAGVRRALQAAPVSPPGDAPAQVALAGASPIEPAAARPRPDG